MGGVNPIKTNFVLDFFYIYKAPYHISKVLFTCSTFANLTRCHHYPGSTKITIINLLNMHDLNEHCLEMFWSSNAIIIEVVSLALMKPSWQDCESSTALLWDMIKELIDNVLAC